MTRPETYKPPKRCETCVHVREAPHKHARYCGFEEPSHLVGDTPENPWGDGPMNVQHRLFQYANQHRAHDEGYCAEWEQRP